jgi:branched-chain amino acid aminotransferase
MAQYKITKAETSRIAGINWDDLRFGMYFSDHIFMSDYADGKWNEGEILPYGPMPVEPTMCTLHYGQTVFEGLKAFRSVNGGVNLFRPIMNARRMAHSSERVCIPAYDCDKLVQDICELVKIDEKFIPTKRGQSLYIRPLAYGSGNFLGVHASTTYRMLVMTSPVASYYKEGLNPVKILVADEYTRAVRGGLGSAKTAANYAASLFAGTKAQKEGYSQVLWLDAVTRDFVDEVGAMNIVFVINNEIITPSLEQGTILAGVTRDTVLTLAKEWGMKISERKVSMDEVIEAYHNGKLQEVFGTGTAAVISPVGHLTFKGQDMLINGGQIGTIAQKLYDTITGIQYGEIEDKYNWNVHLNI